MKKANESILTFDSMSAVCSDIALLVPGTASYFTYSVELTAY